MWEERKKYYESYFGFGLQDYEISPFGVDNPSIKNSFLSGEDELSFFRKKKKISISYTRKNLPYLADILFCFTTDNLEGFEILHLRKKKTHLNIEYSSEDEFELTIKKILLFLEGGNKVDWILPPHQSCEFFNHICYIVSDEHSDEYFWNLEIKRRLKWIEENQAKKKVSP